MNISLNSLSKKFFSLRGSHYAVDKLSCEIKDREFFVLLGPSGCGKSTTLNLIAGLEKPTSGEIVFDKKIIASPQKKIFLSPKERNIAMVFQNYALYPHLNTFDNIAFPLKILKMNERDIIQTVEETADILKLSHLLKSKPNELSGGERQRVAIARAIVRKPDLFLLDEPLSNLDARLRTSTRIELKKLQRRLNVTTIYVTHDQIEAMTLGDRIAVINNGKIEQIGTPDELYDTPSNIFTASFIGNPPMNIFKTQIISEDNTLFMRIANIRLNISPKIENLLKKINKSTLTAGIRPEHNFISKKQIQVTVLKAKIKTRENLGKDTLIQFELGKLILTSIGNYKGFMEGDEIFVNFNSDNIHIFK